MTNQEALINSKKVFDAALRSGLFPTVQDADFLVQTFNHLQKVLSVEHTNNHQQFQPSQNYPTPRGGFESADLP